MNTALSDDETLVLAAHRLSKLLRESTPGAPGWFVKDNDLIGGTCVMPIDQTPGEAGETREVADFCDTADASLIVALRDAAPAIIALVEATAARTTDQGSDGTADAAALAIARAILR